MTKGSKKYRKKELQICTVEKISDGLTDRAGLSLFVTYLHSVDIFPLIDRFFKTNRKSKKWLPIFAIFKQVLCFRADGTSGHLNYFDHLAKDRGYAGSIERTTEQMASSHRIKRFLNAFTWIRIYLFRRLLQCLFVWRLHIVKPNIIELGIDTIVMDNDDAKCNHSVYSTYKKV